MPEQQKPVVTERALADAMDRLMNQIGQLRMDADLTVEVHTDETALVNLIFTAAPDAGPPQRRELRGLQGAVVRRAWNEQRRACIITSKPG